MRNRWLSRVFLFVKEERFGLADIVPSSMEIAQTLQGFLTIDTPRGRTIIQSQPGEIIIDAAPKYEGEARYAHLWHIDNILLPLSVDKVENFWIENFPSPEEEKFWLSVTLIDRKEMKMYTGKAFVYDFQYEGIKANHATLRGATPLEEMAF